MSRLPKVCLALSPPVYFAYAEFRWLLARGKQAEGEDAIKRLLDVDEQDERFLVARENIMTSIELERTQTKPLSFKVLFTGDGSPTKNVRRIWYITYDIHDLERVANRKLGSAS
jgi:hypothetical protein